MRRSNASALESEQRLEPTRIDVTRMCRDGTLGESVRAVAVSARAPRARSIKASTLNGGRRLWHRRRPRLLEAFGVPLFPNFSQHRCMINSRFMRSPLRAFAFATGVLLSVNGCSTVLGFGQNYSVGQAGRSGEGGPGASSCTDSDGGVSSASYTATIAGCLDVANNTGPAACEQATGFGIMSVDESDPDFNGDPTYAYVRFDLNKCFAGKTVTAVMLNMTTSSKANASGGQSGEIWTVAPFTEATLSTTVPKLGNRLAASSGPVAPNQHVTWSLPVDSITAGTSLNLAVVPISQTGTDYWNTRGPSPPQLVAEFH